MHLPLWTSHFRWLSPTLTAWLPAPPWCQSPLLSHVRRWVAGRCHVHRSSRPKPKRKYIVKVGHPVLQLKLRVSAPAMRSTRLVTERRGVRHVLQFPLFFGHISATQSNKPSLMNSPLENALLFLFIYFWGQFCEETYSGFATFC